MSKFMIFDIKTGEKIAECTGLVTRTDHQKNAMDNLILREKAMIPDLHFNMQVPKGYWRLLRRQVMGNKPRIPRKIKKAIAKPCTKSKWLAKSRCFTYRLWRRYCERPMQPGQCLTLQARLYLYLVLDDCKHSWRNQTLKCEMPSGVKVAIYSKPMPFTSYGECLFKWYGAVLYPYRKYGRVRYLDEKAAMYLYKKLGEHIRDKVEQLNQSRTEI